MVNEPVLLPAGVPRLVSVAVLVLTLATHLLVSPREAATKRKAPDLPHEAEMVSRLNRRVVLDHTELTVAPSSQIGGEPRTHNVVMTLIIPAQYQTVTGALRYQFVP